MKDSILLFDYIRNKPLTKAKTFLNSLIEQKKSLDGRYYTLASREILRLLESAEANAESLGLNADKLVVKKAVASKAFTFMLPKSRFSHRGRKAKISRLEVILEER